MVACSQSIPGGEIGVLQSDLDCTAAEIGVYLEGGASVSLNGQTPLPVSSSRSSGLHTSVSADGFAG